MNDTYKKTTAPVPSAVTDGGQSLSQQCNSSISKNPDQDNEDAEFQELCRRMRQLNDPNHLPTVTLTELLDTSYKSNPPVIENLLYTGTYLFVGAPKVGKSFMMAQLSYHVSNGLPLWGYSVRTGTVLYLALEDGYARLQKRLFRMFGSEGTDNLHFAINSRQVSEGLEDQLTTFLRQHQDTCLIIIDTLQKVRELGGEKFSYCNDYDIVTKLKRFSDSYGICLLLVHHTRKQAADDCFDTISGTNGLLGAADGAFLLQKGKRTDCTASLDIAGRDQQDQRLFLEFDRKHCIWQLTNSETELWKDPPDPVLEAVAQLVSSESPIWSGTASELTECLKQVELSPNVLTRRLNIGVNRLLSEYGIHYESSRSHSGRQVILSTDKEVKPVTM